MTGLIAIVLLLVGLPLAAWWLGSRRFWDRLRGRGLGADLWGDWMRRHALSTGEAVEVSRAVQRGEELTGPRLRAAAVDWAQVLLTPARPRSPRRQRIVLGLFLTWAVVAAAVLAHRVLTGSPEDVNWVAVAGWIAFGVWAVRRRRNLHRALERNSAESSASGERP